jgi:hypothetical protein
MTRTRLATLCLAIAAGLLLGLAPAQANQERVATTLEMHEPTVGRAVGQLFLRATLTTTDGATLNNREVAFYQRVEFFGGREAYLGTATTDSTGMAILLYLPAESGSHSLKAHFAGRDQYASTASTLTYEVRNAVAPFHREPLPLAVVRAWLPLGLAAVVLATWVVLVGSFLHTVYRIRRAGEGTRPIQRTEPETSPGRAMEVGA